MVERCRHHREPVLEQAVIPSGWIMLAAKEVNHSLYCAHIEVWEPTTVLTMKTLEWSVRKVNVITYCTALSAVVSVGEK